MRENQKIITRSEAETIRFADKFSASLNAGDIVFLHGDLGMGKSVFSRSVIRSLCDDEMMEVPSPTFTLVQQYDASIANIWHFDLYRLSDESEIYEIGWEEALDGGISLVEWPERLGVLAPAKHIEVTLHSMPDDKNARRIEVEYYD